MPYKANYGGKKPCHSTLINKTTCHTTLIMKKQPAIHHYVVQQHAIHPCMISLFSGVLTFLSVIIFFLPSVFFSFSFTFIFEETLRPKCSTILTHCWQLSPTPEGQR